MTNNKQQTAVNSIIAKLNNVKPTEFCSIETIKEWCEQAKEMEKEQIGYSKEDVLTAGEMGEINTYDTKHIVSYLDEAKQFNETYGGNK